MISPSYLMSKISKLQNWPSKVKTSKPKKPSALSCPQFLMKSPININKSVTLFQKISDQKSHFEDFSNIRILRWNLQIKIFGLKQKTPLRFFEKVGHFYWYLLGISSKIGGRGGNIDFFSNDFLAIFLQILIWKNIQI